MKKLLSICFLILGTSFVSFNQTQRIGYIDSEFILDQMPEYKEAKEKIDKLAERWTKEIEMRYADLKEKKDNFAKEEVILPDAEKKQRSEDIAKLESEAMEMQQLRFGVKGDYFQKRQELIKPIQDNIFDALQKVASKKKYSFVFDKANQNNLIFADDQFDLSNDVLKELGITVK